MTTVLSKKGYSIKKESKTKEELQKIRRELTVKPLSNPNFPAPKSFEVFLESKSWLRVPRWYGISNFGPPEKEKFDEVDTRVKLTFQGELRENQIESYQTILSGLLERKQGIINVQTGGGKTIIFLKLISDIGLRTAFLFHKRIILEQVKTEIKTFLPSARVGIIQGSKKEFSEAYDIYLIMMQTLLNIDEVPPIFGMTAIDECHHVPTESFSKVLFKINSKYLVGLSATIDRKDGLRKVLDWHLGPVLIEEKPDRSNQLKTDIHVHRTNFTIPGLDHMKYFVAYSVALCQLPERNEFILDTILDLIENDKENVRKLLVLTDTKDHVRLLYEQLQIRQTTKTVGFFLSELKESQRDQQKENDIIVATHMMFSEGVSISKLNTLVFASPKREVTQAFGRVYRKIHTEINPMIIEFSDPVFRGQETGRMSIYRKELGKNMNVKIFFGPQASDQ